GADRREEMAPDASAPTKPTTSRLGLSGHRSYGHRRRRRRRGYNHLVLRAKPGTDAVYAYHATYPSGDDRIIEPRPGDKYAAAKVPRPPLPEHDGPDAAIGRYHGL